jgi:hypothetical protein
MRAAIGFKTHSGWAAVVTLADGPRVVHRARVALLTGDLPAQPYHVADGLDREGAEALVARVSETAAALGADAITEIVAELRGSGCETVGAGVVLGSGRASTSLSRALASHAGKHAAEGELYREAVVEASARCGLRVTGVRERELVEQATAVLGCEDAMRRATELGKAVGPPWGQDQKQAALVAWLALLSGE